MKKLTKMITATIAAATMAISASVYACADHYQTSYDSQFLNDMGYAPDRYGDNMTAIRGGTVSGMVDDGWKKAGVTSVTRWVGGNTYFVNGKKITRNEAFKYAADNAGKDYNYDNYHD